MDVFLVSGLVLQARRADCALWTCGGSRAAADAGKYREQALYG
jgi:hypothetical protein